MAAPPVTTITLDPAIRRAVAARIVYEAHPGFSSPPLPYAVTDGHGIRYVTANHSWDPWLDGAPVVAVTAFVDLQRNRFTAYPATGDDWQACDHYPTWEQAYRAVTGETHAAPTDVVAWVQGHATYRAQLHHFLAECAAAARDFVWSELCDTVELDAAGAVIRRYGRQAEDAAPG
jgi:hypothetical protein